MWLGLEQGGSGKGYKGHKTKGENIVPGTSKLYT